MFSLFGPTVMDNPLDVEENGEHAVDFALHSSSFFGLGEFGLCLILSFPNACLTLALFRRFAQNLMQFLCRVYCEIESGQIHDFK
jgi:hypothetical protein